MQDSTRLGVVNVDLGDRNLTQARLLVELGECRWIIGRLATLTLVPAAYVLGYDEQFVEELSDGRWVPERII